MNNSYLHLTELHRQLGEALLLSMQSPSDLFLYSELSEFSRLHGKAQCKTTSDRFKTQDWTSAFEKLLSSNDYWVSQPSNRIQKGFSIWLQKSCITHESSLGSIQQASCICMFLRRQAHRLHDCCIFSVVMSTSSLLHRLAFHIFAS